MTVQGLTFDSCEVTSYDDALARHEHLLNSSVGYRNNENAITLSQGDNFSHLSYSSNEIMIGTGTAIVYGRQFKNGTPQSVVTTPSGSFQYGTLFIDIDMLRPIGEQIAFSILYDPVQYPKTTKNNILEDGQYGFELCHFTQNNSGVTSVLNITQPILSDEYPLTKYEVLNSVSGSGWIRIAESFLSDTNPQGNFRLSFDLDASMTIDFIVNICDGENPVFTQLSYSFSSSTQYITKARIVYDASSDNPVYLEIYKTNSNNLELKTEISNSLGWKTLNNYIVGAIPANYTAKETTFINGFSTTGDMKFIDGYAVGDSVIPNSGKIGGLFVKHTWKNPMALVTSGGNGKIDVQEVWYDGYSHYLVLYVADTMYKVLIFLQSGFYANKIDYLTVDQEVTLNSGETATEQISKLKPAKFKGTNKIVFTPDEFASVNLDYVAGTGKDMVEDSTTIRNSMLLMLQSQQRIITDLNERVSMLEANNN